MGKATRSIVLGIALGPLVLGAAEKARASLLNADSFDYSGTTLNGQSGGLGWNGGWFATGSSASETLSNDGLSLSYPASFEPPLLTPPTAGSRVLTGGISASSSRLMANTLSLAVDNNVMYVSALFVKNAANGGSVTNDNVLLEFVDSLGNRRFGLGIEGAGDKPWLNANASTTAATAVVPGQTYLIVAKIVSSASSTDSAFLKVYTLSGSGYDTQVPFAEPSTWDATQTETTAAVLDRVRVRIDSGNTGAAPGVVDEIRIGSDWASVVPEPSSLMLLLSATALAVRRRR